MTISNLPQVSHVDLSNLPQVSHTDAVDSGHLAKGHSYMSWNSKPTDIDQVTDGHITWVCVSWFIIP
jgi:hypothetical protein